MQQKQDGEKERKQDGVSSGMNERKKKVKYQMKKKLMLERREE